MDCEFCRQRTQDCPALTEADPEKLADLTPFAMWATAAELATDFFYTERHILRLVQDPANGIIFRDVNGAYFILKCSFERFFNQHQRE